ncbi:glucose-6-phosphate isomerase [Owenweeksia hongkongensis]|uniref:glucose-6-phosphate isomerase n=1 Tax=Owenweeksia hongkongensis TaxID=253245 RepID=UPI003A94E34D
MLPRTNPTQTNVWQQLKDHQSELSTQHMRDWFLNDSIRFKEFSLEAEGILFDFSKNIITKKTLKLLKELFDECGLPEAIKAQFEGKKINETEGRAVLHTALRNFDAQPIIVNGVDVMPEVQALRDKMKSFSKRIISGEWKGYSDKKISDIVNIGIGGSSLGPSMVYEALSPYQINHIACHFVSNVDAAHLLEKIKNLNPETTLFIIASKTFTTQETMTNANSAKDWFLENGGKQSDVSKHFVAVSTNQTAVEDFGIDIENMFGFWDWVGGRYSLWSPIGLSLCCGLGYENFERLLRGAFEMDKHFTTASFHENAPVLMAAIGMWYTNFWNSESEAIIPYNQNMHRFAAYFQQGNMESNGKSVDRNGKKIDYQTGPIIWGQPGTNGQHAFFQLIHQGTRLIPCDFIGFAQSNYDKPDHHQKLMSNFFAQTEALMKGKTKGELESENVAESLIPFKIFEGNKPTTSIVAPKLTPKSLGKLIACYEHKIFTQGVIWNIFSFDQWGVELGKSLAKSILPKLKDESPLTIHDSSTAGLINYFRNNQ